LGKSLSPLKPKGLFSSRDYLATRDATLKALENKDFRQINGDYVPWNNAPRISLWPNQEKFLPAGHKKPPMPNSREQLNRMVNQKQQRSQSLELSMLLKGNPNLRLSSVFYELSGPKPMHNKSGIFETRRPQNHSFNRISRRMSKTFNS
jgi:uncharacterized protein YbdZ (MbtH family)